MKIKHRPLNVNSATYQQELRPDRPATATPEKLARGRLLIQNFALGFGIVFLVVGIAGFIPGLSQPEHTTPPLVMEAFHGRLLGLFPINLLHNVVHLLIGVWGILGARNIAGAIGFSRGLAIFYGLLAIMGLIPGLQTLFGLIPIHGHDVWLHAGSALIAAYFGFGPPARSAKLGQRML
ncbi:MAG: DUF4383 domain-containing protein [Candidatus Sericytochromatia bacterium]